MIPFIAKQSTTENYNICKKIMVIQKNNKLYKMKTNVMQINITNNTIIDT